MTDFLDDCVVCKVLKIGSVEEKGEHCTLLRIGGVKVAALNYHEIKSSPEALAEAFKLLKFKTTAGHIAEYDGSPGHWAVKLVPVSDLPVGTSSTKQ